MIGATADAVEGQRRRSHVLHKALPSPYHTSRAGVYGIINSDNGKIYIGSSYRLNHRWAEHRMELENQKHGNRYFQKAFNKNPDAFQLEVIEEVVPFDKKQLLEREQFWMNFYRSFEPKNGYNIAPKAESCQGIKRSPEFLDKVSKALSGKKWSDKRKAEFRFRKKTTKFRGPMTESEKEKHRALRKGKSHPYGPKISQALKLNPPKAERVFQFDTSGRFIREFRTIKEAEFAIGGRTNIHQVCKGKRRLSNGFMWRYARDATRKGIAPVRYKKIKPSFKRRSKPCQMHFMW